MIDEYLGLRNSLGPVISGDLLSARPKVIWRRCFPIMLSNEVGIILGLPVSYIRGKGCVEDARHLPKQWDMTNLQRGLAWPDSSATSLLGLSQDVTRYGK